jgi:hypothetical protein
MKLILRSVETTPVASPEGWSAQLQYIGFEFLMLSSEFGLVQSYIPINKRRDWRSLWQSDVLAVHK